MPSRKSTIWPIVLAVRRLLDGLDARALASVDEVQQARPLEDALPFGDVEVAGPEREDLAQQLQRLVDARGRCVRAEVPAPVTDQPSRPNDPREVLAQRDLHERVALVVAQPDVEPRSVLLDEVALEEVRLADRVGDDVLDVRDLLGHPRRSARPPARAAPKYERDAAAQGVRLADVQDASRRVLHEVHAGAGRQAAQHGAQRIGKGALRAHAIDSRRGRASESPAGRPRYATPPPASSMRSSSRPRRGDVAAISSRPSHPTSAISPSCGSRSPAHRARREDEARVAGVGARRRARSRSIATVQAGLLARLADRGARAASRCARPCRRAASSSRRSTSCAPRACGPASSVHEDVGSLGAPIPSAEQPRELDGAERTQTRKVSQPEPPPTAHRLACGDAVGIGFASSSAR